MPFNDPSISLGEEASKLWDTDEKDRLVKLAIHYPNLLTYEEQVLWKIIRDCDALWKTKRRAEDSLNWEKLRENWALLNQVANGAASKDELPKNSSRLEDFDDDIPF